MPPEFKSFNGADIIFTINGEVIGNLQSTEVEVEKEIKNGDNLTLFNRGFTCTLENVEVNEEFIGKLFPYNKTFTVIGTGYRLPRGNKLPKKKRIRKKWMKKYGHDFKLDNCIIG